MAAKIATFANKNILSCKVAYLKGFDLLRAKICVINTFGAQLPVKNRLKWKIWSRLIRQGRKQSDFVLHFIYRYQLETRKTMPIYRYCLIND